MADEDLVRSLKRFLEYECNKTLEWVESWAIADIVILECCYPEYGPSDSPTIYSGISWIYTLWAKRLFQTQRNQLEPRIVLLSHDNRSQLIEVLENIGLLNKNDTVQLPEDSSFLKTVKIPFCLTKLVKILREEDNTEVTSD